MRRDLLAIVALASVSAVYACADGPDSTLDIGSWNQQNPEAGGAKKFYVENVHPMFQATCTWCHAAESTEGLAEAPRWLSYEAEQAYTDIEAYGLIAHPDNSLILLQGEHQGPALQPNQVKTVKEWLTMEVEERGLPDPEDPTDPSTSSGNNPPGLSATEALDQFAACMSETDFQESMFYLLAYNQTAGMGPCLGCHTGGWGGALLDDDQTLMYDMNKQRPYVLKLATAEVVDGAFSDIVQSNRFRLKGTEICNYPDPSLCHPKYTLNPQVDAAVTDYFNRTYDRWKNGLCDGMGGGGEGGAGGGGGAGGAGGGA
jgi:hypothetical protein